MSDTDSGGNTGTAESEAVDESGSRPAVLRVLAVVGGAGLVGSYALPWVDVTGETLGEGSPEHISARELELLPELAVALGVLAVVLAVLQWTTKGQLVVLVFGLGGTGLTLFVWFLLGSDSEGLELGSHVGPPEVFEPALGLLVALVASLVLVGASFLALLSGLETER